MKVFIVVNVKGYDDGQSNMRVFSTRPAAQTFIVNLRKQVDESLVAYREAESKIQHLLLPLPRGEHDPNDPFWAWAAAHAKIKWSVPTLWPECDEDTYASYYGSSEDNFVIEERELELA